MPDVFTKRKRSEVMSRIRGRGNKETELALAKLFRKHGITGWRRHQPIVFSASRTKHWRSETPRRSFRGNPDFVFPRQRLAVFVDGCFWHGCPKHANMPANNRAFWRKKLLANIKRDRVVNRMLRQAVWTIVRIWEHDLTKHPSRCLQRICRAIS